MRHRAVRLGVRLVGVGIVLFFLARAIVRYGEQIASHRWQLRALPLVAATVVEVGAMVLWATVWWHMVGRSGSLVRWSTGARIYLVSNLAKYIPGSVWGYVSRGLIGRQDGLRARELGVSVVQEVGITIVASLLLTLLTVFFYPVHISWGVLSIVGGLGLVCLVLLLPPVANRWLSLVLRSRGDNDFVRLRWRDFLYYLAAALFTHVLVGTAFFLFVQSIADLTWDTWWCVVGIWSFSATAGLVAVVVPYGLGVKEGLIAMLLQPFVPIEVAVFVSIASRLWTIAAELLAALLGVLLLGRANRRTKALTADGRGSTGDVHCLKGTASGQNQGTSPPAMGK